MVYLEKITITMNQSRKIFRVYNIHSLIYRQAHIIGTYVNMILSIVLVNLGCHNKIPPAGWFKSKFIFSQFWRLASPRSKFWQGLTPGESALPGWQISSLSSHVLSSDSLLSVSSLVSLPKKTLILSDQDTTLTNPFILIFLL